MAGDQSEEAAAMDTAARDLSQGGGGAGAPQQSIKKKGGWVGLVASLPFFVRFHKLVLELYKCTSVRRWSLAMFNRFYVLISIVYAPCR